MRVHSELIAMSMLMARMYNVDCTYCKRVTVRYDKLSDCRVRRAPSLRRRRRCHASIHI